MKRFNNFNMWVNMWFIFNRSNINNQKCINCKDSGKYFLNDYCVIRDDNINTNYNPSTIKREKEYYVL